MLLAGGQWVRSAGAARLSVVVVDPWRADALAAAFAELGFGEAQHPVEHVAAGQRPAPAGGGIAVRTVLGAELAGSAARWARGATQAPPDGLTLTAGGLRLWAVAAGRAVAGGYLLGTLLADDVMHRAAGAQLARLGLAAISSTRERGWRVTSRRRVARLAELLGAPPPGGAHDWPRVP